jgi:hypothetical protein
MKVTLMSGAVKPSTYTSNICCGLALNRTPEIHNKNTMELCMENKN